MLELFWKKKKRKNPKRSNERNILLFLFYGFVSDGYNVELMSVYFRDFWSLQPLQFFFCSQNTDQTNYSLFNHSWPSKYTPISDEWAFWLINSNIARKDFIKKNYWVKFRYMLSINIGNERIMKEMRGGISKSSIISPNRTSIFTIRLL